MIKKQCLHEVRDNKGDIKWSVGPVDHALKDELTATDAVLERDRSDILPILKFIQLFDSAGDLQKSPVHHHTEVSGVKEAQTLLPESESSRGKERPS